MIWIIGGFVLVIGLILIVKRGIKGPKYTLETLEKPITGLLKQGYNGGFLIIEVARSKYFLQLRKYIHGPKNYGIELCFPNAEWSFKFFQKLITFCDNSSINYSIEKEADDRPLEFLYINFGKNSKKVHDCVKKIFLHVFELDEDMTFFARLENATVEDKLIER